MKTVQILLSAAETSRLLGNALGPSRNWENVLNDFRQYRLNFKCDPLMPYAQAKRGSNSAVPLYRPCDVQAFIEAVRNVYGEARPFAFRLKKYVVEDCHALWGTRVAIPVMGAGAGALLLP